MLFYRIQVYFENYGKLLNGFQLGSDFCRFVFQKDICKDREDWLEEKVIYLIFKYFAK